MGAGFQGISLVTGLLGQSLSPCAKILFEKFSIDLRYVDAGWAAAAGIAYSTEIGAIIIPVIIAFNILMLTLKLTRTVNIDIWNYWHYAFIGSLVYAVTGNLILGFLGAFAYCAFSLRMADYTAKDVQEALGVPGISIPQAASISTAPIAYVMEWIYNRIPGFKNLHVDVKMMNKKMGVLGDPIIMGFILGTLLGFAVGYNVKDAGTVRSQVDLVGFQKLGFDGEMNGFPVAIDPGADKAHGCCGGAAAAGMALPVKAVQAVGHDTADHLGGNFLPVEQKGQRVRQGRGSAVELGFLIGKRDFHGRAPHFSE